MTNQERQGWFIVASLFITVHLLVGGGYDTTTVFIPALIKHFGLSLTPQMLWCFAAGRGAQEKSRVASGIAPRGSHGSGRAELPHPALRFTASLRDGGGTDAWLRQRIPLEQPLHSRPGWSMPVASGGLTTFATRR